MRGQLGVTYLEQSSPTMYHAVYEGNVMPRALGYSDNNLAFVQNDAGIYQTAPKMISPDYTVPSTFGPRSLGIQNALTPSLKLEPRCNIPDEFFPYWINADQRIDHRQVRSHTALMRAYVGPQLTSRV